MRNAFHRFIGIAAALGFAGCVLITSGKLESRVTTCTGQDDGTPCMGGDYCFAGECRFSFCGDGIANVDRGEECDDGNLLGGDGCEPVMCRYSCDAETPCADDGNICNGPESCSAATHACTSGPAAPTGTPCALPGGEGACSEGYCVPPGCGDGEVVEPEDCEPPESGCLPDCSWECADNEDCPSSDLCGGLRACDLATHTCYDLPDPSCADTDPCTNDSCDPNQGCRNVGMDADRDGYAPLAACGPGSTILPGDCNDAVASIHPGAPEQCGNNVDDDCDGMVDESTTPITCMIDGDGDGFGDPATTVTGCSCPPGYVPSRVENDCNDNSADVRPNLEAWQFFITPYCADGSPASGYPENGFFCGDQSAPSFDYDCDKSEEPQNSEVFSGCIPLTCSGSGWGGTVPACGQSDVIYYCTQCGIVISSAQKAPIPPPDCEYCETIASYYNPQGCR